MADPLFANSQKLALASTGKTTCMLSDLNLLLGEVHTICRWAKGLVQIFWETQPAPSHNTDDTTIFASGN